jgi:hypothetical protein
VTTTNSFLKNLIGEFRPYAYNRDIIQKECNVGFGSPSGHSLKSIFMCYILYKVVKFKKPKFEGLWVALIAIVTVFLQW